MRSFPRAVLVASALAFTLTACLPGLGPAATDTIDLGGLGRFSEPDLTVSATASEDYNPRGPRTVTLVVTAADADGNVVRSFTMREDNVSDGVTPSAVGDFPGIFAPPHLRQFTIAANPASPASTTAFGRLEVTEFTVGERTDNANGWTYEVTHLRASFEGSFDTYGLVDAYLTIG